MITNISNSVKWMVGAALFTIHYSLFTSCSDMLNTESELVEFQEDNTLNHPTDSVYSVLGVINRLQVIADRTVLLGEIRGDLVKTTDAATADLKRLALFDFSQKNKYNQVADYYAVINNCNYYLAHIDTLLERRGRKLFQNEYAVVKAYRAWTYLELAKAYGQVPLVTQPLMTEREAANAANGSLSDIKAICDYFIDDLTPYAETPLPQFGSTGGFDSQKFFIPMRALLGDLCLWAGRYAEAAQWYNKYLNDKVQPIQVNSRNRVQWASISNFLRPSDSYSVTSSNEVLSFIPMETRVFNGYISDLQNVFSSTKDNDYYFQVSPSQAMRSLSADQIYCMEYKTETSTDTIYVPRTGLSDGIYVGDLRLSSNYSLTSAGAQDPYSEYSNQRQRINKLWSDRIATYRVNMVYLRYAEALNRAGYPQSAFLILKHGICPENIALFVDSIESSKAGQLIEFDPSVFKRLDNDGRLDVVGIHSLGSGDSHCNEFFTLPQPKDSLATRQDTIDYQMPLVEDMIINEMALEGAFEGCRYYDLMRVALRRSDPTYLANPVSRRNGEQDEAIRQLLLDQKNWYIPLQ